MTTCTCKCSTTRMVRNNSEIARQVYVLAFRFFILDHSSSDVLFSACSSPQSLSLSISIKATCFFCETRMCPGNVGYMVLTPSPPPSSKIGPCSSRDTPRLLSETPASSFEVIFKIGNEIAGKLAIVRKTSTFIPSGKLTTSFIKFPNTLSISWQWDIKRTTLLRVVNGWIVSMPSYRMLTVDIHMMCHSLSATQWPSMIQQKGGKT